MKTTLPLTGLRVVVSSALCNPFPDLKPTVALAKGRQADPLVTFHNSGKKSGRAGRLALGR